MVILQHQVHVGRERLAAPFYRVVPAYFLVAAAAVFL